jgi:site-specific recombinase XerD
MLTVKPVNRHDPSMARRSRSDPETLQAVVDAWLANYESGHTRAAYRADLDHFGEWARAENVNPFALAEDDIRRYRAACETAGAGPSTVARRLSAIASFGAFAHKRGTGLATPRIERPTLPASSTTESLGDDDATALLTAADQMNPRSALLVRLLMLDGLKVGEVVTADAGDLEGKPPCVTLTLHTGLPRVIELHPDTGKLLAAYLGNRRSGPLLLSEHRAHVTEPLTRFGVDYIVKQAAESAGIAGSVSANTLRRRFVMNAHDRGQDLDGIRADAGHADARTTRRYLHTSSGDTRGSKPRT